MDIQNWKQYEVVSKRIGKGKNAEIYLAFDPKKNNYVAIKKFLSLKTANHEYEMMKNYVENKFLPTCYEFFILNNQAHIVMDFIKGEKLSKFIESTTIDEKEAIKITKNILQGLVFLHDMDIAHNDLHLRNIMIDNDHNIKIIDFGRASKKKGLKKDLYRAVYTLIKLLTKDSSIIYKDKVKLDSLPIQNHLLKDILNKGLKSKYKTSKQLLEDLEKIV